MSKIIIENISKVSDSTAIDLVQYVISQGRISNNGKQYCYVTIFRSGVAVSSHLKKSDRFIVSDNNN
jgi:hypothetical protein